MRLTNRITPVIITLASIASIANAQYTEDLASSFDLRDVNGHNYLSPVQNQGPFGACYSFGATAAAESTYNMAMGLYDENAANFSESYIIWYLGQFYDGFGGEGANYDYNELQALVDHEIISDADFPYVIEDPGEGNYHTDAESVSFSSWHRIASFDVQTMKYVIQNIGALDAAIYVTDAFQAYQSGDEAFSQNPYTYRDIDYRAVTNHAISLVGWDDSEGVNGAWILRNSWGTNWGDNGYMYLSYNSSMVSTAAAYLVYGDWEGEDFTIVNDEAIVTGGELLVGSYDINGIYEWGGNNASITNNADVTVGQMAYQGDAVAKGISLWAGENASLENNGTISVTCLAAGGYASAYGLLLQGHSLVNTGDITVTTDSNYDSNSYAIRFLSYDNTGEFHNSGTLTTESGNGQATTIHIDNAAIVENTGDVTANGADSTVALSTNYVGEVINEGNVSASSTYSKALGAYINTCASFTNNGTISATSETESTSTNDWTRGIYSINCESIENTGTISATAESSFAFGIQSDGGSITNTGTIEATGLLAIGIYADNITLNNNGTITGTSTVDDGISAGVYLNQSGIINNGTITGGEHELIDCTLGGSGSYVGSFYARNTIFNPGNSVGTITIDGNAEFIDNTTINLELTDGEIDKIVVTGSLDVDGDATINLVTSGYIPEGDYSFLQAEEITYSDDTTLTFVDIDLPLMFENSKMVYNDETVSLAMDRHSYAYFTHINEISAMAKTLDKVRTTADGNLATLLTSIDYMETSSEIANAISEFFPAINYTTGYAAMQNLHRTDEYIMKHNKYMTLDGANKYSTWFNFVNNDEDVDAFNEIPGYSTKMRGYVGGFERKIKEQYAAGLALGTTSQTVNSSENADFSKIKGNQYYAYATWDQHKETKGYYVVASLGYGDLDFDTERQMGLVNGKINSSHKAKAYTAAISGGCEYSYSKILVRPYVSLKYAKLSEDAYTEDGTQGVSFTFDEIDSKSLEGSMGFSVGSKIHIRGITFMPEVHVEYATELDSSADSIYAEFETGDGFTTPTRELSDETITYGCSISAKITENAMFNVAYDFIDYDSYNDEANKFSTALQIRF